MATMQSVQQQLDDYAAEFARKVPAEVRATMQRSGQQVEQWLRDQDVLGVGDEAPDFTLPDATGRPVTLSNLLDAGPTVLSFYRGGWCPYCNIELRALQAALPDIRQLRGLLLAVSPQTPDASLSTQEKNELEFPVLSDVGNQTAREFGLVFTLPEPLRPIYEDFGIDVPADNGDESFELPTPATYVIDRNRAIRYAFVNADYRQRAEPAEVLGVLRSLGA